MWLNQLEPSQSYFGAYLEVFDLWEHAEYLKKYFFFHGDTSITTKLKLLVRAIQNPKKQGKVREKTKTFLCAVTLLEIHRQVIISN
jgi:hypothetical protein